MSEEFNQKPGEGVRIEKWTAHAGFWREQLFSDRRESAAIRISAHFAKRVANGPLDVSNCKSWISTRAEIWLNMVKSTIVDAVAVGAWYFGISFIGLVH